MRPCTAWERARFERANELLRERPLSPPLHDDAGRFDYSDRTREFGELIATLDNEFPKLAVA